MLATVVLSVQNSILQYNIVQYTVCIILVLYGSVILLSWKNVNYDFVLLDMCVHYSKIFIIYDSNISLCCIFGGEVMYDIHCITITVFMGIPEINNEMFPDNHSSECLDSGSILYSHTPVLGLCTMKYLVVSSL